MGLMDSFNEASIVGKLSLLVGFGPPGLALAYLLRPAERTLAILRPVSLAGIFAALCGLLGGAINVLLGLSATRSIEATNVYLGLSEALVAPMFNFGLLAVAWLLVAVGMIRRPRVD